MEKQEYYGFSIQFPGFSNPVVFYVPSTQERTTWMSIIEKMSKVCGSPSIDERRSVPLRRSIICCRRLVKESLVLCIRYEWKNWM